eukprot:TRINITY_DN67346_c0_g1_i1.p2 TRINITY_DN67346_c0_g1~~TRINITY_DN67346_c0_g1_i1.p2  ORF type:complete len:136 (+),score=8.60 TRINITY_DN67346_c0_g1_i1:366-773(+)
MLAGQVINKVDIYSSVGQWALSWHKLHEMRMQDRFCLEYMEYTSCQKEPHGVQFPGAVSQEQLEKVFVGNQTLKSISDCLRVLCGQVYATPLRLSSSAFSWTVKKLPEPRCLMMVVRIQRGYWPVVGTDWTSILK